MELLPIRLFPSTSAFLSRATSTSGPVIRIRNSSHFPIPPSRSMSSGAAEEETEKEKSVPDNTAGDVVVQYVVLRRDLVDTWPTGSVVAQGCHASVAAIWAHRDHPDTASYLSDTNIDSMHKVVLEVKGEIQMRNLSEKLNAGGIEHKLWMEQPENIPTCLATRPYPRSRVASYFKKLKLSIFLSQLISHRYDQSKFLISMSLQIKSCPTNSISHLISINIFSMKACPIGPACRRSRRRGFDLPEEVGEDRFTVESCLPALEEIKKTCFHELLARPKKKYPLEAEGGGLLFPFGCLHR